MVHLWATNIFCLYLDIDVKFGMLLEVWTIVIKYVMINYTYGSLYMQFVEVISSLMESLG